MELAIIIFKILMAIFGLLLLTGLISKVHTLEQDLSELKTARGARLLSKANSVIDEQIKTGIAISTIPPHHTLVVRLSIFGEALLKQTPQIKQHIIDSAHPHKVIFFSSTMGAIDDDQ